MATLKDVQRLDKIVKPFAYKFVQIVLQSRLSQKSENKLILGSVDPFGIAIDDVPKISSETKDVLFGGFNEKILCIDISLKFNDGECVKLENWTLEPEVYGVEKRILDIHNRMGLMLKSVLTITRTLPAYQMLKKLNNDPYKICYKIYLGKPDVSDLGNQYKTYKLNKLHCGLGSATISVSYRTKLVKTWKKLSNVDRPIIKPAKKLVNLDEPMKVPAFVDADNFKKYEGSEYNLPEYKDLKWLYKFPITQTSDSSVETDSNSDESNSSIKDQIFEKIDHFKDVKSIWSVPEDDNRFAKELNCPFAKLTSLGELAQFYRYFDSPPSLEIFKSPSEERDNISQQLDNFEKHIKEYDRLIKDL